MSDEKASASICVRISQQEFKQLTTTQAAAGMTQREILMEGVDTVRRRALRETLARRRAKKKRTG